MPEIAPSESSHPMCCLRHPKPEDASDAPQCLNKPPARKAEVLSAATGSVVHWVSQKRRGGLDSIRNGEQAGNPDALLPSLDFESLQVGGG